MTVYDAPERANGTAFPASDIWSLGVTLVEALTQRTPDWNRSGTTGPAIPESVPQPYFGIARRCLQLDPSLRCTPSDIEALIGLAQAHPQLARHIDDEDAIAKSKAPMFIGTAILLVAAIAVAIALYWMRSHQPQSSSPAGEQQQTQAPAPAPAQPQTAAPAQPARAQQQPAANAPQEQQPQSQPPVAAPAQTPPASEVPAPSNPAPVTATPAGGGAVVKGTVAQEIEPVVSESAGRSIHGTIRVKIRVHVAPDGNVSNATFDSEGPSRYFAKVAMQAAQQWKFKPARVNGHAAPGEWTLQFQFTRFGSNVTPLETAP